MTELAVGIATSKLAISSLVVIFIIYIVTHIIIAVFFKKKKDELEYWETTEDVEKLKNKPVEELKSLQGTVKFLGILYKWFPAITVILLILWLYS